MHKLVTTALIALLLIASPLMMFGTSDSNIFSKAMAIEEDGSESDIKSFIKSNDESEGNDESSDEGNDESSDEGNDESSDEGNDESSNAIQQNQNNDEPQPVVDTSQPIQQIQNNEPQQQEQQQEQEQEQQQQKQLQTTKQSQQGNKGLSIISQEEMQQQQYENFKKLYESVKQQHKEIEILK